MWAMPQAADARDGCGPGYYYNGYRCRPMDRGYGPGYGRRYEEPYYERHYYYYGSQAADQMGAEGILPSRSGEERQLLTNYGCMRSSTTGTG